MNYAGELIQGQLMHYCRTTFCSTVASFRMAAEFSLSCWSFEEVQPNALTLRLLVTTMNRDVSGFICARGRGKHSKRTTTQGITARKPGTLIRINNSTTRRWTSHANVMLQKLAVVCTSALSEILRQIFDWKSSENDKRVHEEIPRHFVWHCAERGRK